MIYFFLNRKNYAILRETNPSKLFEICQFSFNSLFQNLVWLPMSFTALPSIPQNYFLVQRSGKSIGKMARRLLSDKMERRQVHLKWKVPGGREIEWKKREGKKGWSITSMFRESDVSGCFCSAATYFYFYGLLSR